MPPRTKPKLPYDLAASTGVTSSSARKKPTPVPVESTKPKRLDSVVLDDKRKLLADLIAQGVPKSKAFRAAGYDPNTARQVMREEDIISYIQDARDTLLDISTIRRADVLNIYLEAVDMARVLADPAQMINAGDKIAKLMGFYEPEIIKVEVAGQNNLAKRIQSMTDEELEAIAASRARLVEGEVVLESTPCVPQEPPEEAQEPPDDDEGDDDDAQDGEE